MRLLPTLLFLLLGLMSAISYSYPVAAGEQEQRAALLSFGPVPDVPVIHVATDDSGFALRVRQHRTPVVLRGTVASTWPALAKWAKDEYLAEAIRMSRAKLMMTTSKAPSRQLCANSSYEAVDDALAAWAATGVCEDGDASKCSQIKRMDTRTFVFASKDQSARPAPAGLQSPAVATSLPLSSNQMTASDILAARDKGEFLYYSGTIPFKLRPDLQPHFNWFQPDEDQTGKANTAEAARNIWLGSKGVIATTHYDAPHNLYIQLRGRKRFLVHPPRMLPQSYLHPRLHERARQSQLDWNCVDGERYPRALSWRTDALSADLIPGDVLYLPPFWLHRVIAEDFSVSVNTWTDSRELQHYYELMTQPLPFDTNWPRQTWVTALKSWCTHLLEAYLVSHGESTEELSVATQVEQSLAQFRDRYKELWIVSCPEKCSLGELTQDEQSAIRANAATVARKFLEMERESPDARDGRAISQTLLFNFFEDAIQYGLEKTGVVDFILCCL